MTSIRFTSEAGLETIISIDAAIDQLHTNAAEATEHAVERGANISDHVRPMNARLQLTAMISNHPIKASTLDEPVTHTDGAVGIIQASQLFIEQPARRNPGNPILVDPGQEPFRLRDTGAPQRLANFAPLPLGPAINIASSISLPTRQPKFEEQPLLPGGRVVQGINVLQWSSSFDRVGAVYKELLEVINSGTLVQIITKLRKYDDMVLLLMEAPRTAADGDAIRMSIEAQQMRLVNTETVEITEPVETRGEKSRRQGNQKPTPAEPAVEEKSVSFAQQLANALGGQT